MTIVNWRDDVDLDRPVLIASFAGWNDAGEAATLALRHLIDRWRPLTIGNIDTDEFIDFSVTRPIMKALPDGTRLLEWPDARIRHAKVSGRQDVLLLECVEPQLRWRRFAAEITRLARDLDVRMIILLGGLLSDVPHTRPVPVSGASSDSALLERLSIPVSGYEGPTGIVGVLHEYAVANDIPVVSLWAAVPHYVSQIPSPKAALALVDLVSALVDLPVSTLDLHAAVAAYEQQITEMVQADEGMIQYVLELEEDGENQVLDIAQVDTLASEAEQFLRRQNE